MKNYKMHMLVAAFMLVMSSLKAQNINWANLNFDNRHMINATIGADYGAIMGIGYGYKINNRLFPMIANVEYSFASGEDIFDDIKTKVGARIRIVEYNHFNFSANLHGVIRRYENDYARLVNFGSDLSGVLGYYRSGLFVAGELGFDKAIITHYRHSDAYTDNFPGAKDGWYGPATGGNFYYGAQAGFSFGKSDVTLRVGKLLTQDFKTAPTLPYYGQIGYNATF